MAIASRRLVLGDGGNLELTSGVVLLRGRDIERVERVDEADLARRQQELAQQGYAVSDEGQRLVAPAFVDAHTHLSLSCLRACMPVVAPGGDMVEDVFFEVESKLCAEDVRAFTRMGAYEALLAGTGFVWDHYYFGEAVAAALQDVGLAGVVAPTLQDLGGPGQESWEAQLACTEGIAASRAHADAGVFAALGPHATDTVSSELFGRALDLAERRKLPLHLHAAQSTQEQARVLEREGQTPLAWLASLGLERAPQSLLVHVIFAGLADLEGLPKDAVTLALCPYSQLQFAFPARCDRWEELGLSWVVGSDCAASNDTVDVRGELRFVAGQQSAGVSWSSVYEAFLKHGGPQRLGAVGKLKEAEQERVGVLVSPQALLERVWSRPGLLHPAVRCGALLPGALANIAVWDLQHPNLWPAADGDPLRALCFTNAGPALHRLVVAGRDVGTPGDLARSVRQSDAYLEARREASERLRELLQQ